MDLCWHQNQAGADFAELRPPDPNLDLRSGLLFLVIEF